MLLPKNLTCLQYFKIRKLTYTKNTNIELKALYQNYLNFCRSILKINFKKVPEWILINVSLLNLFCIRVICNVLNTKLLIKTKFSNYITYSSYNEIK